MLVELVPVALVPVEPLPVEPLPVELAADPLDAAGFAGFTVVRVTTASGLSKPYAGLTVLPSGSSSCRRVRLPASVLTA